MWLKADSDLTKSARSRRPRNQLKHPRTSYLINTDQPLVANLSNAARYPSRSSISHDTTFHIPCSAFIFISLYTMIYIFILPEFAGFWWLFDMFFSPIVGVPQPEVPTSPSRMEPPCRAAHDLHPSLKWPVCWPGWSHVSQLKKMGSLIHMNRKRCWWHDDTPMQTYSGSDVWMAIRSTSPGDVSVLAFCKWRSLVEIVLQDVKDALLASEATRLHHTCWIIDHFDGSCDVENYPVVSSDFQTGSERESTIIFLLHIFFPLRNPVLMVAGSFSASHHLGAGRILQAPALSSRVVSYRAGYPPALRRQLERDIFHRKANGLQCCNPWDLKILEDTWRYLKIKKCNWYSNIPAVYSS